MDGTFSSNGVTLIHVDAMTSSNVVQLVGTVVAPSECSEAASFLTSPILHTGPTHCVMADEGKAIKKSLDMCGVECVHTLCMFHLLHQLPRKKVEGIVEWRRMADVFAGAARGTTSTNNDFMRVLRSKGGSGLASKLVREKDKWCRESVRGMRRDYIASLSEGLNGAIKKKISGEHWWSAILKEFIAQSEQAQASTKMR